MDMKRLAIGTIVGAVMMYVTGYVIFEVAFGSFYAANIGSAADGMRTPSIEWIIALSNLPYALLLTLAFESKGGQLTISSGFVTAFVIGLLVWASADLYIYAATNVWNKTIVFIDPWLSAVNSGIGGAVIAAVLARVPKSAALQPAR